MINSIYFTYGIYTWNLQKVIILTANFKLFANQKLNRSKDIVCEWYGEEKKWINNKKTNEAEKQNICENEPINFNTIHQTKGILQTYKSPLFV